MRWEPGNGNACVATRVPAKLNLFLSVRGRRPDGFHELVTVFQSVSLFDRVRAGIVGPPGQGHHPAARRRMRVALWHDAGGDVPSGSDNLAVKAARALGEAAGVLDLAFVDARALLRADPEVDNAGPPYTVIDLRKTIPVGAGMAGGSADAAATLIALNELWACDLSRDDLRAVAATIGSDVPFCVVGGTAIATGRGTAFAQVLCRGTFHWVVCTATDPLPTPEVFRSWDRHCSVNEVQPDAVIQALRNTDAEALGAALHNDLEAAAFALRPELAEQKQSLTDAGALGAVISGSGPTLLGLAASAEHASELCRRVSQDFKEVRVASSPAGGPELGSC